MSKNRSGRVKKGFTLIELLAVIVILAVIALIAVPVILSLVDKSRRKAAEESAVLYVDTIENMLMLNNVENTDGKTYKVKGRTVVDENDKVVLNLEIKGDVPYNGVENVIKINSGFIEEANLRFNSYYVHYEMDMTTKKFKTCTSQKGFLDKCDGTGEVKPSEPEPSTPPEEDITPIELQVGQYVQMVPSKTEYTITSDMTGCTGTTNGATNTECPSNQTIYPSELTLWRVIRVNEDGTYDMVSDCISSEKVYLKGKIGAKKLVGTLNTIAAQYTDNKYIVGARAMGFNGQVEELEGFPSGLLNPIGEAYGKGDTLYITDTDLVQSVYGRLRSHRVTEESVYRAYWLASRYHINGKHTNDLTGNYFDGRAVLASGDLGTLPIYAFDTSKTIEYAKGVYIRPIVTLSHKFAITSGDGTLNTPYVLKKNM
jgi:type IV pilus assembly protein PilA